MYVDLSVSDPTRHARGPNEDAISGWILLVAFAGLFLPTAYELFHTLWQTDDQGHGPIILAVSAWLLWRRRTEIASLPRVNANGMATGLLLFGLVCYALGRSQAFIQLEVGSHIIILAALFLFWRGAGVIKLVRFPLFFLCFMVPLPGAMVQALTVPLKSAVSYAAEQIMYAAGYPIARAGVVLHVGQYQLLVADACAGLNSMFTLESLGLLYMNLMGYASRTRNLLLATLIIPISFVSNVFRVVVLVLVTYHLGDAAGQGFVHGFAGMVLFIVALMLMLFTDKLLGKVIPGGKSQ